MNKKKSKVKSVYIYLGIIVLLLVGIYALGQLDSDNPLYGKPAAELNAATRELLKNENYQNIILPEALDQKVANGEDFFVYMFSPSCHICRNTTPHLMPLANEMEIRVEQFNVLEFPEYQSKYGIDATPTLIYFKDGVEADRIEGGINNPSAPVDEALDVFRDFFEKNNI